MKSNVDISVVTCVYNEKEKHLREAIESILNQTYKNFEFIIILDNPDNEVLKNIINEYKSMDNRIIFLINEKNIGAAESANKGLKIAKGKYIARMDGDDVSFPKRLEKQKEFLDKNPECILVSGLTVTIDENSNILSYQKRYFNTKIISKVLPYNNPITHSTIMFRKEAVDILNGYRNFEASLDYDFYLRFLSNNLKICVLPEYLVKYRVRKNGISETKAYKQTAFSFYIRELYKERIKNNNVDSFSEEDMKKYKEKMKLDNKIIVNKLNKKIMLYRLYLKKGKIFRLIYLVLTDKFILKKAFNTLRFAFFYVIYSEGVKNKNAGEK
ncbi:glycosyltransferase [Marinitoga sp. 1137]|uniref:glycosyltransferase n=1 Tax=Marinitoga sp. 1137 TaxID=1545835 RepID=UPI001E611892|nr:glycosyltransferase [Marinitoga sp. 1137]